MTLVLWHKHHAKDEAKHKTLDENVRSGKKLDSIKDETKKKRTRRVGKINDDDKHAEKYCLEENK